VRLAIALLCTVATPAFAQATPADPAAVAVAADAAPAEPEAEAIVVTGTRIRAAESGPPTPVVRSTADDLLRAQPLGIAEALIQLPQFSGSVSPRARQANPTDGRGNFLNLRNVGVIRTLILLDGERLPPTTVSGQVDVDVIPELLVKQVDVATSGVSAVYGSDAVTGVVNYILDPDFSGLTAKLQSSISTRGDAPVRKAALAGGTKFSDGRGHASFSVEYVDSGSLTLADRPLGNQNILAVGLSPNAAPGTAANPYVFASDTRSGLVTAGGRIVTGPWAILGQQFDSAGRVVPFDPGIFAGQTTQIGGSGLAFVPDRTLITGGTSARAFGHLAYEIAPRITLSAEGLYSKNTAQIRSGTNFVTAPIYADNAFLRPETRAVLTDPAMLPFGFDPVSAFVCGNGSLPSFCEVKVADDLTRPTSRLRDESYTLKARLRGEFGAHWGFNVAYIHGHTTQRLDTANEFIQTNLYAALDAVRAPNGQIVCRVTLTNPGLYPGCVPYNPFGAGANDANRAAVEAYVLGSPSIRVTNKTDDVVATLTGQLGHTWAGPIRVAAGAEYRRAALSRTSNSDPATPQVRTGIQGIDPAAPPFIITNVGPASGSQNVKEANIEVEVPLARNAPLLHSLGVSGAARYTDYSTSGGVTTWKLGAKWEPLNGVLLRAARSRDIRAPTLFDLFAGGTSQRAALVDLHCNCQPPTGIAVIGGGNPALKPEIADSLALGIAVTPALVRGLTASVDFYDLKIRNAITVLSPAQVIQECETAGGSGPACAAITRPLPFTDRSAANAATSVFTGAINAAALRTRGLDFDLGYSVPVGASVLGLRLVANRVLRYVTQGTASAAPVSSAGVIDHSLTAVVPKWTGTLDVSLRSGPLYAHVAARYIDSLKIGLPPGTPGGFVYTPQRLPAIAYLDAGVSRRITSGLTEFEIFADAHNLADQGPPVFPGNNLAGLIYPAYLPLYDVVGRTLTVGIRLRR
jgi:iron complex outermembrane receptor protein